MKITEETIYNIPEKEQPLVVALLNDLAEINHNLPLHSPNLELEWIDTHTEYSPERVDPCPDYYGYYRLKFQKKRDGCVGDVMTIDELDNALCILFSYNFLLYGEK
jgi:hypothetical protein